MNPDLFSISTGPQGLPHLADKHAESQVPGLHPAERIKDDGGATSRHQSEPATVVQQLYRRVPQLVRHWRAQSTVQASSPGIILCRRTRSFISIHHFNVV